MCSKYRTLRLSLQGTVFQILSLLHEDSQTNNSDTTSFTLETIDITADFQSTHSIAQGAAQSFSIEMINGLVPFSVAMPLLRDLLSRMYTNVDVVNI